MDCEKFQISKIFESEPDRTSKSLKILNQVGLVAPDLAVRGSLLANSKIMQTYSTI